MLREGPSDLVDSGNVSPGCTVEPPCSEGEPCPHDSTTEAAVDGNSAEKVREVAREVARVCSNLDLGLLETCYRNLYDGHHGDELLNEFVNAYHKELSGQRREVQVKSSKL